MGSRYFSDISVDVLKDVLWMRVGADTFRKASYYHSLIVSQWKSWFPIDDILLFSHQISELWECTQMGMHSAHGMVNPGLKTLEALQVNNSLPLFSWIPLGMILWAGSQPALNRQPQCWIILLSQNLLVETESPGFPLDLKVKNFEWRKEHNKQEKNYTFIYWLKSVYRNTDWPLK